MFIITSDRSKKKGVSGPKLLSRRATKTNRGEKYVGPSWTSTTTITDLIEQHSGNFHIACDTEFEGLKTLTVQFATRIGKNIVVQVYSSNAIPKQPKLETLKKLLPPGIKPDDGQIIIRRGKPLTADLSPVRVIRDLFQLKDVTPIDRLAGSEQINEDNNKTAGLAITFIAHFWNADFFRVFGKKFFTGLVNYQISGGRLVIQARKLLCFKETDNRHHRFNDPVLEYAGYGEKLHPIKVKYFDTCLAFGKASLDDHAKTFLQMEKAKGITHDEKTRMQDTFHKKTRKAYAYAILDAILTLRIHERMIEEDKRMYQTLGFADEQIPPLRPTQGSRVAEMITKSIAQAATGSILLSQKGKALANGEAGNVSANKLKKLLIKGSGEFIAGERDSKFGQQTGETQGGLLFSRSPTKFFHNAPGQLRDVDLSGCYAAVIGSMNLYVGRPVIHEPGPGGMSLKDAVEFATKHAAGPDAWIIKASGPITAAPNTLIPSTRGALTHANYQDRLAKKRANSRRSGFIFDWLYETGKHTGSTAIYTDVIEAGIIAWPTWLMIQAMPTELKKQYENLEVESLIFYPSKMVADTGPEFDALRKKFQSNKAPWKASLDMGQLQQVIVKQIDQDHVCLRYNIGQLAQQISVFREQAKKNSGSKSGTQLAWKLHANSMYGVAASQHLVTNNVVCANVITATGRALAFAMQMSLNGIQVITDGCTYRRDQIPKMTYAECLKKNREYPIRRVENGIPFYKPETVPEDNAAFTEWYRAHVKKFFGVKGPDYDKLFGLHNLEHKTTGDPERTAFDGLCCDGSGNYLKLLRDGEQWKVSEMKARGYKREAKAELAPWILQAYSTDTYTSPPPITASPTLLTYKDANRVGKTALEVLEAECSKEGKENDPIMIYYPLGLEHQRVQPYKVIKPSAFLFKTPEQQKHFLKAMQKFTDVSGCGLEAIALRRSTPERQQRSIVDVAELIYKLIRTGKTNLTKALNLTRSYKELEHVQKTHYRKIHRRKRKALKRLIHSINSANLADAALLTGLFVQKLDILPVQ